MEWKPGMKVRCIKEHSIFKVGDVYELTKKIRGNMDYWYWDTEPSAPLYISEFFKENWEVIMEYKKGDIIKLKLDATIGDMVDNDWNGCQMDTLGFIQDADDGKTYRVNDAQENFVEVETSKNYKRNVNPKIVELVERQEEVKEVTMEELNKMLGYKVKIKE